MDKSSADSFPTLAVRFSNYVQGLVYEEMPRAAIHEVKRRVIDSLGCAIGAWPAAPCEIVRHLAKNFSAKRGATIWGTNHRAPIDWAAFANGCLVRYFDYNDTYLSREPAHPSDNIPACIAVAEEHGASGRELIAAIIIAYEVQCRLCDAASLRSIGWDHVTYGAISSTLGAARLMQLDAPATRHAVGIATVACAALRQTRVGELSHWKGCAFANAARQGVFAAMLAGGGMTGPSPIFEGKMGFEKLVSGPLKLAGPFAQAPVANPNDCMICKTSIKYWPVEYHAQSAVEASLALRTQIPDLSAIQSVVVESHDAAVDIIGSDPAKWSPNTRETADHSLPYIVAAALLDGQITDHQFSAERFRDPVLLNLLGRVKVTRHAELSAAYPRAVGNIITVTLRDGSRLVRRVDFPYGSAVNPLSDADVEAKFHALADARIGLERAGQLLQTIWKLDELKTIDDLPALLEINS